MVIYLGADHGGFALKEKLKAVLKNDGYDPADMGSATYRDGDDYPDFAIPVARRVSAAPETSRGILICRSGFGMDITANKFPGVRAALPLSADHIYQGRHDDDVNILCIAADFMDETTALNVMKIFLSTPFAREERYARRLGKITNVEDRRAMS